MLTGPNYIELIPVEELVILIRGIKIDAATACSVDFGPVINCAYESLFTAMHAHHSLLAPLRQRTFRHLWIANLLSNLGSWGQTFALTWQVATMSESTLMTALVQTATWLPMCIFSIPAGLIADVLSKPKLMLITNTVASLIALGLSLLTEFDAISPTMLLTLTFLSGTASAFTLPAWQTSMSEMVNTEQITAVVSLNNLSYNLAACLGPLLGSLVMHSLGASPIYLFNAFSFCGLLVIYYRWQPNLAKKVAHQSGTPTWMSHDVISDTDKPLFSKEIWISLRPLLVLALLVFGLCSAFPALLASIAREYPDTGVQDFGKGMAALGAGAVAAAILLPPLRHIISERKVLLLSISVFGLMMAFVTSLPNPALTLIVIICGGVAWSGVVTGLNSKALRLSAHDGRTRKLSIYILTTAAAQAIGAFFWGQLANEFGALTCLMWSGLCLQVCAALLFVYPRFLDPH